MAKERTDLTNEAFKINGTYIEDVICGYTTLKTSGRETLEKQLTISEGPADGAVVRKTRYPERVITVEFLLVKNDAYDLREGFNQLAGLLDTENAQIIFNDEADRYLTGSFVMAGDIERAIRYGNGTFEIHCADPFKYALTETVVSATSIVEEGESVTALTTNNAGTYKTFPRFEITFANSQSSGGAVGTDADCGFVQLAKGDYSLQFGDDLEQDQIATKIFSQAFTSGARGGFSDANGTVISAASWTGGHTSGGSSNIASTGLSCSSFGSGGSVHGPYVVYTLNTAASGDFVFEWKNVFALNKTAKTAKKQKGNFAVLLIGTDNSIVAGVELVKTATTKTKGSMKAYIDGVASTVNTSIDYKNNGVFGFTTSGGSKARGSGNIIRREGGTISIKTAADSGFRQFTETSGKAIKKVLIFFGKNASAAAVSFNRCLSASFTDGNYDAVNSFGSGDELSIDTALMEVILNNRNAESLGDISNDWENVFLDPGDNVLYCAWSEWVRAGYEPAFKMYYRKRWI